MDLVENSWHALYFVDDDLAHLRCGEQFFAQVLGVLQVAAVLVGFQQIDLERVGVGTAQQRALAGLAWSPEEERLLARRRQVQCPVEHRLSFIVIIESERLPAVAPRQPGMSFRCRLLVAIGRGRGTVDSGSAGGENRCVSSGSAPPQQRS